MQNKKYNIIKKSQETKVEAVAESLDEKKKINNF